MESRRSDSEPQGRGAEGRSQGQRHRGQEEAVAEAAEEAQQAAQALHLRQPGQGQGRKSSSVP